MDISPVNNTLYAIVEAADRKEVYNEDMGIVAKTKW